MYVVYDLFLAEFYGARLGEFLRKAVARVCITHFANRAIMNLVNKY